MEEYYWRWFAFGRLRRICPLWLAVAVSSGAFMLHHVVVLSAYVQPQYFWGVAFFFSLMVAAAGADLSP